MKKMEEEKRLKVSANPHIKDKDNVNKIMWYVIAALLPAAITGVYFFGVNAVVTEFLIGKFTGRKITIKDGSAVLTGLLLALVLSPLVPWWIAVFGSVFAISIGKMVFGGLGHNIFNPALVGRAFLVASSTVAPSKNSSTSADNSKLDCFKTLTIQYYISAVTSIISF